MADVAADELDAEADVTIRRAFDEKRLFLRTLFSLNEEVIDFSL